MIRFLLYQLFLIFPIYLSASWAEKTLDSFTLEEKVGQLFVIPICPLRGNPHFKHLKEFLNKYPIGGVLLKQSDSKTQVSLLNALQKTSPCPLLTLADGEWGLGMRIRDAPSYPKNLTLGAIQNLSLIREMGRQIGEQSQLVGIHINLSPVADVNTNPKNPVIHTRSFGDDPKQVSLRVVALFQGMQEKGLWACAKHWPGHGDSIMDSHHGLPLITHSPKRLRQVEWIPFKEAIFAGIKAVMSAHLLIPAYDLVPCSFSHRLITETLQKELKFNGLILTDALNMRALTNHFSSKEIGLNAFLAGHHLLLYGSHENHVVDTILREIVPEAYQAILEACVKGEISEEVLNRRVLKILQAKEALGLHLNKMIPQVDDLTEKLNRLEYTQLKELLFEEAITLYRDEGLPDPKEKIAYIQVGRKEITPFFSHLKEFFDVTPFLYHEGFSSRLKDFDATIIALYEREFPKELKELHSPYIALFHSPYALQSFPKGGTVIVGYESSAESERGVADVLKGKKRAKGILPIQMRNDCSGD